MSRSTRKKGIECEVRFHGASSRITGKEVMRVHLSGGCTLKDLLAILGEKWPELTKLLEQKTMLISLNGRVVGDDEVSTKLNSTDTVIILPFVAGG